MGFEWWWTYLWHDERLLLPLELLELELSESFHAKLASVGGEGGLHDEEGAKPVNQPGKRYSMVLDNSRVQIHPRMVASGVSRSQSRRGRQCIHNWTTSSLPTSTTTATARRVVPRHRRRCRLRRGVYSTRVCHVTRDITCVTVRDQTPLQKRPQRVPLNAFRLYPVPRTRPPTMLEAKLEEAALLKRLLDCGHITLEQGVAMLTSSLCSHQRACDRCQLRVHRGGDRTFPLSKYRLSMLTIAMKNLQAMDNSHVALVAVNLEASGFKKFRCDRPMPLGVNLNSLTKVLKCAKDDDICVIKASDDADVLNLVYEAKSAYSFSLVPPPHYITHASGLVS